MYQQKGLRALRGELINTLSEEEQARLAQSLGRRFAFPNVEGVDSLRTMNAKKLFDFLYFQIFGRHPMSCWYGHRVLENIEKVRKFIHGLPPIKPLTSVTDTTGMQPGLSVNNVRTGSVSVEEHAWERFIERYPGDLASFSAEEIGKKLKAAFLEAISTSLKKHHLVKRIIQNDFQAAEYYYCRRLRLRFVVVVENGRRILRTVEKPY